MDMIQNKLAVYIVLNVIYSGAETTTFDDHKRLHHDIERKTNENIRPIFNQTNALNVTVMPKLLKIQALMESKQMLFCTVVIKFTWVAETLQWSPAKFGGINFIHMPSKNVWLPDIVYQNTISDLFDMKSGGKMKITIAANGTSTWEAGSNLISHCRVDVPNYPFDTQKCHIIIGKVFSDDNEVMIVPKSDTLFLEDYEENEEWILLDNKVSYFKIEEDLHFVHFEVTLKRRPLYYMFNIVFPVVLLSMMNVFSFKIPSSSGERISYSVSMLLTFCVFLSIVSQFLPKGAMSISYLQLYISIQLAFCIMITIASILNLNFAEYGCQVPRWIKTIHMCTYRRRYKTQRIEPTSEVDKTDGNANNGEQLECLGQESIDKKLAVRFVDNFCFWLFMFLYLFSTVILFSVMVFF